jgi:hypothetical protein
MHILGGLGYVWGLCSGGLLDGWCGWDAKLEGMTGYKTFKGMGKERGEKMAGWQQGILCLQDRRWRTWRAFVG